MAMSLLGTISTLSLSAGGAVALAGAAILGLYLGPLAFAASASLLVILPCATAVAVQTAPALLVVWLAGLWYWEHLTTATALEPTRIPPESVNLLLGVILACLTGDPCLLAATVRKVASTFLSTLRSSGTAGSFPERRVPSWRRPVSKGFGAF